MSEWLQILLTAVLSAIGTWVIFLLQERYRTRRKLKEKQRDVMLSAHKTIERELSNLTHWAEGKPYRGEAHRRAVQVISLEVLDGALRELRNIDLFIPQAQTAKRSIGKLTEGATLELIESAISDLMKIRDGIRRRMRTRFPASYPELGVD